MSDATDDAQRTAEKKAGKKITEAKKAVKKVKKAKGGTSTTKTETKKFQKTLKRKLNKIKGLLAKRDYEAADNLIDDILDLLDKKGIKNDGALKKALEELEIIKDEDLWISPTVTTLFEPQEPLFAMTSDDSNLTGETGDLCLTLANEIAMASSLDHRFENTPVDEVEELPLDAIEGISKAKAQQIQEVLGIQTVGDFTSSDLYKKASFISRRC